MNWSVRESESSGRYSTISIESDISDELLAANAVLLAAVTLNFNLNKLLHLRIKVQVSHRVAITGFCPESTLDVVLERSDPGVHWRDHRSIEGSKLDLHLRHLLEVFCFSVVHVVENKVSWRPSATIIKKNFEVVVEIRPIDETNVLIKSKLDFGASHERNDHHAKSDTENDNLSELVENHRHKILSEK
jgi:hypothetical protein